MNWTRTKHIFEYSLLRTFDFLFSILGPKGAFFLANGLGRLIYWLASRHRTIALENLRHAFGDTFSEKQRKKIVCSAFQNLTLDAVEICLFPRLIRSHRLEEFIQFPGKELVEEALSEGRGAFLVTCHLGNWELGGCGISMSIAPLHSIARRLKNPFVDRWLNSIRQITGGQIIPKDGALRKIVSLLGEGKFLAFLLDQHAGDKGIPVQFFGREAFTFDSVATLSKRFRTPVIFGYDRRIGHQFRHEFSFIKRIDPGESSVLELTQQYTDLIEDAIRENPGQWLWMHRRWKPSKARKGFQRVGVTPSGGDHH